MTDYFALPPRREEDTALLSLAYPFALDAMSRNEESAVNACLVLAEPDVRRAFHELTRDAQETMALLAAAYSTAPPPELRAGVLEAVDDIPQRSTGLGRPRGGGARRFRWRCLAAAAAGVTAVAVSGFVVSQLPNHLEFMNSASHSRRY